MRSAHLSLALLLAVAGAGGAHAASIPRSWGAYGNVRFSFAVCYPPSFKGQGEADNSDGQRFRTADGAELAAYGANESPGSKVDVDLALTLGDVAGPGAHVTYRAQKPNWLAVSGVGPKGEFYVKRIRRGDQLLSWELVYPARLHARYAPLTAPMVSCFTVGSEPGY